jgi:thiaminase/transcriptional activator TenA
MTTLRFVYDSLWTAATRHPFLDAVRDGTITDSAFDRWLAQDALFVADLLTFQARLLARAPRPAQVVLAGGCAALVAELDWFEDQATRRGLDLNTSALPATLAYRELLQRLDAAPYEAAVTALWVIERVYLLAWTSAASDSTPFSEFVEHWSTHRSSRAMSPRSASWPRRTSTRNLSATCWRLRWRSGTWRYPSADGT